MSKQQYAFFPNYLKVSDYYSCVFNIAHNFIRYSKSPLTHCSPGGGAGYECVKSSCDTFFYASHFTSFYGNFQNSHFLVDCAPKTEKLSGLTF